ncbi:MAG TPA: transcription antitermination factor NusB [Candidatus Polarisedimenticolia bacterium]|nr:transcription antitermination factor NusB [Candidatus Polarisedimenticolia bacterium]
MSAKVGERRRAREYALQLLFQLDLSPEETEHAVTSFWNGKKAAEAVSTFADRLVSGTMGHRAAIDDVLAQSALNWRISRMAVVDRNILRMAIYEFFFEPDTPRVVVIDEAIEIAKKFGNDESGPFINGILDAIRIKLENGEIEIPPGLASPAEAAS